MLIQAWPSQKACAIAGEQIGTAWREIQERVRWIFVNAQVRRRAKRLVRDLRNLEIYVSKGSQVWTWCHDRRLIGFLVEIAQSVESGEIMNRVLPSNCPEV
jgi:hypothetical protein